MLEILQGAAYTLSIMFFWSGSVYFDLHVKKMKMEAEAQKRFAEMLKNKEFIQEYLNSMKVGEDEEEDSREPAQD